MTIRDILLSLLLVGAASACVNREKTSVSSKPLPVVPEFSADSAWVYCKAQCDFGPRTMNSLAHDECGRWIASEFARHGLEVSLQRADLLGWDSSVLRSTNIIARYRPETPRRVLLCAHWDSRPWADNDADEAAWHTPVTAANDGASGVAVMLETARLIASDTTSLSVGIDFVCFDAEDYGVPSWSDAPDDSDSWALGAQHWAADAASTGYTALYGILLDMVGGEGARFYRERYSMNYASDVVAKVWQTASRAGYSTFFPQKDGGMITDDHVPVCRIAGIPCIDIVPFYPDCEESSFGPTWHTTHDTMDFIDRSTLKAVGQTLIYVLKME